jgi:hypothetical protein
MSEQPPFVGKVIPNFCMLRGVAWAVQQVLTAVSFSLHYPHKAEQTLFLIYHFSENMVAPGIKPGTSGSVARNSDH